QALHLRGEQRAGAGRVLRVGGRRQRAREAVQAADAVLERLDQRVVLVTERARRRDLPRPLDVELLLARQAGGLLLELRLLLALREQHLVELLADLLRGAGDLGDLAHVVLVGLLLARLLAALDPEDEQDDDQDREGDQADEAEQRRQVRRAARRTLRAA